MVAADARLGKDVSIGPNVAMGEGCRLYDRVEIGADCCIGRDVVIGESVRIRDCVRIGDGARIEAGVRIEQDAEIGPDTTLGRNCTVYLGQRIQAHVDVPRGLGVGRAVHGSDLLPRSIPEMGNVRTDLRAGKLADKIAAAMEDEVDRADAMFGQAGWSHGDLVVEPVALRGFHLVIDGLGPHGARLCWWAPKEDAPFVVVPFIGHQVELREAQGASALFVIDKRVTAEPLRSRALALAPDGPTRGGRSGVKPSGP